MKRALKLFLTGGNGFVGRNIREQLGKKYHIDAPSRKTLDLCNTEDVFFYIKKGHFDVVIHAAVIGGSRKEEEVRDSVKDNLTMFFNIQRCRHLFGKYIHIGSGAEYDKSRPLKKIQEDAFGDFVPKDAYGFFKYVCARYLEHSNTDDIHLRVFGLFGKYEDYRYRFISNALCNNVLSLPITMNKNVVFDYVFIDDFVNILDHFLTHTHKEKVYNIGSGQPMDLLSIARTINDVVIHPTEIIVRNKGYSNEYTCRNKRLLKELPGFTFTPMRQSIQTLYRWYVSHKRTIRL